MPAATQLAIPIDDGTAMLVMIQALIPVGLTAVEQALQQEVTALAGRRYAHGDTHPERVRWGAQAGSIYLADQKLPIQVPRVRDRAAAPLLHAGTLERWNAGTLERWNAGTLSDSLARLLHQELAGRYHLTLVPGGDVTASLQRIDSAGKS